MLQRILQIINYVSTAPAVSAHCDGPCGVYDPASARIAAEAAQSMTKKIVALGDGDHHTLARYTMIKEEQAELAKRELLILWTDYFKPEHLVTHPDLHETVWKAAKLCSTVKQEVSETAAQQLMDTVAIITKIFQATKK
jgi:nickel superoxide dismutase